MEISNVSYNSHNEDALLFTCSSKQSKHVDEYWTFQENKLFEEVLALYDSNSSDFFENITTKIPNKTIKQIKDHFEVLVEDIKLIEEKSLISTTNYTKRTNNNHNNNEGITTLHEQYFISSPPIHQQTKKGARWTKEEHEYDTLAYIYLFTSNILFSYYIYLILNIL